MVISMIAAIGARTRALGKDNHLIWHIPDDLKRFKTITNGHPVIMGRKTWESLPEKFRPLPGRLNIVVTRQENYEAPGAEVCNSLEAAIEKLQGEISTKPNEIFIIGGGELYKEALPRADKLYLTLIDDGESDAAKDADVFFPEYESAFTKKVFGGNRDFDGLHYMWIDLEK